MKYLKSDNYYNEVKDLFSNNEDLDIAIAFLGYDSKHLFELNKNKVIRIVCNFQSGACNPYLVEEILNHKHIQIKSNEYLHAKTLIQKHTAIIGSANLSANGLSLEGSELTAWNEVGILTNDDEIINESNLWFDNLWNQSSNISSTNVRQQKENWKKRRKSRPIKKNKTSLIQNALSNEQLKDREIYFAIYHDSASEEAESVFNEVKKNHNMHSVIDFYEDWPTLPDNAYLISFHVDREGEISFDDIYSTPEKPINIQFINSAQQTSSIKICFKEKDIEKFKLTPADMELIKKYSNILLNTNKQHISDNSYVVPLYDWIAKLKNLTKT